MNTGPPPLPRTAPEAAASTSSPGPVSPPASSARALLWLCLGVALLAVALYFLLGDAWLHWFPRE